MGFFCEWIKKSDISKKHFNPNWHEATAGVIAHICFKWFQITADAHPGVSWVSSDQKFCEKFKNTHCQVDHPAKIE